MSSLYRSGLIALFSDFGLANFGSTTGGKARYISNQIGLSSSLIAPCFRSPSALENNYKSLHKYLPTILI